VPVLTSSDRRPRIEARSAGPGEGSGEWVFPSPWSGSGGISPGKFYKIWDAIWCNLVHFCDKLTAVNMLKLNSHLGSYSYHKVYQINIINGTKWKCPQSKLSNCHQHQEERYTCKKRTHLVRPSWGYILAKRKLSNRPTHRETSVTNCVPVKLWLFKWIPDCRYKSIIRSTCTVHQQL